MEPDERSPDDGQAPEEHDGGGLVRRARLRAVLVTVTMLAVLALIVIGVVRIVQS